MTTAPASRCYAAGGPGKPTGSNPGRAPRSDPTGCPYDLLAAFLGRAASQGARDDDASLLDLLPLLADTTDLLPERIQAALYQAFDIQALYRGRDNIIMVRRGSGRARPGRDRP
jgi:hypothetical protein